MPISLDEFSYTMDLGDKFDKVPDDKKKEVKELIGLTVKDLMVEYLDKGVTPVSGGKYKKSLSKEYKSIKKAKGKSGIADLDLTSNMLNSIKFTTGKGSSDIKFNIRKNIEKAKAFNHNTGDTLPQREFMPDDEKNGKFKPKITKAVNSILDEFIDAKDKS